MSSTRRNLYLSVYNARWNSDSFAEVARRVEALDPTIRARVIRDRAYPLRRWARAMRPSLTVSMVAVERLRPLRGPLLTGRVLGKCEEMRRLGAAGLPVPEWRRIEEGADPDLSAFGSYVVVKPDRGGRGAEVRIRRRGRVRWRPDTAGLGESFAQRFIYTGRWPVSYRVAVLFGRVLFCFRMEADSRRAPLESPDDFRGQRDSGGKSIVATGIGCRCTLADDAEILDLGRRCAAAFPKIPLLGVDIVREQPSRRLYVLEVNANGRTWHLSSETGRQIQSDHGIDFATQFDGLGIAAEALVDATRRLAR